MWDGEENPCFKYTGIQIQKKSEPIHHRRRNPTRVCMEDGRLEGSNGQITLNMKHSQQYKIHPNDKQRGLSQSINVKTNIPRIMNTVKGVSCGDNEMKVNKTTQSTTASNTKKKKMA